MRDVIVILHKLIGSIHKYDLSSPVVHTTDCLKGVVLMLFIFNVALSDFLTGLFMLYMYVLWLCIIIIIYLIYLSVLVAL